MEAPSLISRGFIKSGPVAFVVSSNCRTSSISVLGKVMERCIYKHVYNVLLKNSFITPHQSGFTPGDSAINQLLSLTNEFGKALDEGKEIRVVFCDISKAFDRVWHKGLLNKLENIGIQGSLLLWIKNYLADRKQRVVIESAHSKWRTIKAGVPQGSILGPLFFIIFINDIVTEIHSSIKYLLKNYAYFFSFV
jgi:retron-type reverse transcriptase